MTYTSLISASDFTGVRTDVTTAAGGILSLVIIVIAVGMLIRVFTR